MDINTESYELQSRYKTINKILKEKFMQLECVPGLCLSIYIIVENYIALKEIDSNDKLTEERLIYFTILLCSVFYKSPADVFIII